MDAKMQRQDGVPMRLAISLMSCALMMTASSTAVAQSPWGNQSGDTAAEVSLDSGPPVSGQSVSLAQALVQGPPPGQPMMQVPGNPGVMIPPAPGMGPGPSNQIGAIPPGMGPWPRISPFETGYARTQIEDGLWTSETRNLSRTKYFQLESLFMRPKEPNNTLVSHPSALDPIAFATVTAATPQSGFRGSPFLIPSVVGEYASNDTVVGLGMKTGWWNEDDTGVEFNAFYLPDAQVTYSRGVAPFLGNDPANSRVTHSIFFDNGTVDPITGDLVPVQVEYDRFFQIESETSSGGTGARFYMTPSYERGVFKVQGFGGLDYKFVREGFSFIGVDSGLALAFNVDGSPIVGTAVAVVNPFFTQMASQVTSHVLGPQLGLRYELGGDNFRVFGSFAVGAAMNSEELQYEGQGVGDGFQPGFDQNLRFLVTDSSTHVSPTLDFEINAEMRILQLIPVIKKMKILEDAKLRVGYRIMAIGEVARPTDIIDYRAQPLTPRLQNRRSTWYSDGVVLSLDWTW